MTRAYKGRGRSGDCRNSGNCPRSGSVAQPSRRDSAARKRVASSPMMIYRVPGWVGSSAAVQIVATPS